MLVERCVLSNWESRNVEINLIKFRSIEEEIVQDPSKGNTSDSLS